jgi:hypothetical protein
MLGGRHPNNKTKTTNKNYPMVEINPKSHKQKRQRISNKNSRIQQVPKREENQNKPGKNPELNKKSQEQKSSN